MKPDTFLNRPAHRVHIRDIHHGPGPCCMSYGFDIHPLVASLKAVGLINAPLVVKNADQSHDVVLGVRRIQAMLALGEEKIPCRVLSASEMSPLECLLMNLNDNLAIRVFNEVEKAMVISRLSKWLPPEEVLGTYMPLLGLPAKEHMRVLYCRLEKELDEKTKTAMVKGHVSLHAARLILEMEQEARTSLFELMSSLKFNFNQQGQLIEYLVDISHVENRLVSEILAEEIFRDACFDMHMNNPQKVKLILRELRCRIFPRLTDAEQSFKKTVSDLNLPAGVRINAAPFFESPQYRMEIIFRNGHALREKLESLSRVKGLEYLRDPWETDPNG